jgi:phage terminase large subunit
MRDGWLPIAVVRSRAARSIECLPWLQHDPNRPEDVLKVDVDDDGVGGDDAADCFR